jgi:hypothetical protein
VLADLAVGWTANRRKLLFMLLEVLQWVGSAGGAPFGGWLATVATGRGVTPTLLNTLCVENHE